MKLRTRFDSLGVTPDGAAALLSNARSDDVSIIDVAQRESRGGRRGYQPPVKAARQNPQLSRFERRQWMKQETDHHAHGKRKEEQRHVSQFPRQA